MERIFTEPQILMTIVERFGIPFAFALLMVALLIWFASQHRAERTEWRETMISEGRLNRDALGELSKVVNSLAVSVAYSSGKSGRKRK